MQNFHSDKLSQKIIDFFEEQALLHPNSVAIIGDNEQLTYQELNDKSNEFCNHLIKDYGVVSGDYIALTAKRKSPHLISVILGILKANAIYLPINSDYPESIINDILSSTKAKMILNERRSLEDCNNIYQKIEIKVLNETSAGLEKGKDIAYAMYTSGTTGKPKGVNITHRNLIAAYLSWSYVYALSKKDNHLQMANISFDVFIGDLVRALCSGGTLVLCQTDMLLNSEELFQKIIDCNITVAEFVPAILNKLISYAEKNKLLMNTLRLLLCGSDLWSVHDAKRAIKIFGKSTTTYNSYGLTEATIDSTYFKVTEESLSSLDDNSIVPIGTPFPHVTVNIKDKNFLNVPFGNAGELVLGGEGISPYGYINAPDLTKQKFVSDGMNVLYRTGDTAKFKLDGYIEFQGRNESQVNINGKRIELPSVEYALLNHKNIESAIVSPSFNHFGQLQLTAYVALKGKTITKLEIYRHLEKLLPKYAIPCKYYEISELPLTINGKLNRKVPDTSIFREIEDKKIITSNSLTNEVMLTWMELLDIKSLSLSNSFQELGGNSLLYIEMLEILNEKYKISLKPCMELSTIPELVQKIYSYQKNAKSKIHRSNLFFCTFFNRDFPRKNKALGFPNFLQKRFLNTTHSEVSPIKCKYTLDQTRNLQFNFFFFKSTTKSCLGNQFITQKLQIVSSFLRRRF